MHININILLVIISAASLFIGIFIGWLIALRYSDRKHKSSEENMLNAFKIIAAEELEKNSQKFGKIASDRDNILKIQLNHHKEAITNLLDPLSKKIDLIDKERVETFGKLANEIKRVSETNEKLRNETGSLVNALRKPQVRGRWGEMTLRRVVELAGMTSHIDFYEQESESTETGRKRPDMIIRLPENRNIVVDSKVALEAYIDAFEHTDEAIREELFKKHAKLMKNHIINLSRKKYWEEFSEGIEFTIMFVPNDAFLEAAFQYDPTLPEYALQSKIIIATPATLMAILQTIEFSWKQISLQENAREISLLGKELYSRVNVFFTHLDNIRSNIVKLIDNFNKAVGSIERKILPQMRRFNELGASDRQPVKNVESVSEQPRSVVFEPDELNS